MRRTRWIAVLLAFGLAAAACGDDDDGGDSAESAETTAAPDTTAAEGGDDDFLDDGGSDGEATDGGEDPCEGVTLEATETGVTEDTITVLVMADVGSELAPGLFQGSIDGTKAWAQKVNDNGGLACRQVEVVEWDSALNPTETTNGFLEACDNAIAMVGSNSLFVTDLTPLNTCPDGAGNAIGVPDIAGLASTDIHQCSPNVFPAAPVQGSCPYSGSGPRNFLSQVGPMAWVLENELGGGPVQGIYMVPSDLPTTIAASMPLARAQNAIGIDTAGGEFGVSGRAEQATFGAYIQNMIERGALWAYNGSNDQAMIKLRKEAAAQGFAPEGMQWVCSLACYTPDFIDQGGADVEGTWVNMQFIPFQEADTNEELATFLEYFGDPQPPSWAANSWAAGLLFEQAVNAIIERDGPNALTRQVLLDELNNTSSFDANGWYGELDFTAEASISPCFVVMQVQNGEYVRVHPEEPGTLDCSEDNLVRLEGLDAAAEFQG